ncbi:hypothetical protein RCO28_34470 [Streptomyces sp. LHD-70]|uniref:hypothetical protein n=1 Tax=Streptomyces sp. LHD-70 TaxID=3072140 RepID=UPI00280F19BA|nr:hypothetical protein [Streptomyces sp. LHD-70]MDQ8707538.1 hypothetical protein [Streptomyces sp. LHD-70]
MGLFSRKSSSDSSSASRPRGFTAEQKAGQAALNAKVVANRHAPVGGNEAPKKARRKGWTN